MMIWETTLSIAELSDDEKKGKWASAEGIKFFKSYAIKHFAEEEEYMRSIEAIASSFSKNSSSFTPNSWIVFGMFMERLNCSIFSISALTCAEVTEFSVITDYAKGIKYPLADFEITPDVAIVDPALVESLPETIGDPPPIETIQSGWNSFIASAPFITVSTEGSGSTPSKNRTSMPASFWQCGSYGHLLKNIILPFYLRENNKFALKCGGMAVECFGIFVLS